MQTFSAEIWPDEMCIVVFSFVVGRKYRCNCKLGPELELDLWLPPRSLITRGADSSSLRSMCAPEDETNRFKSQKMIQRF